MAKTFPAMNEFTILLEKVGLSCQEACDKFGINKRTMYRWMKNGGDSPAYGMVMRELQEMDRLSTLPRTLVPEPLFTYIDLFAGIGGFRRAFDQVGGRCVFTSEWDKASRVTYLANNKCDHPVVGDIREYTRNETSLNLIPQHDLLVAGFPCQPFSVAGVSKKNSLGREHGFKCDTQGTLFFDVAQIIEHHRPTAFVLENVKNLVSHDQGKTFRIIKRTLESELGYNISYRIIDGKSWVPQHRERIIIVGFRNDVGFDFRNFVTPDPKMGPKLSSILHGLDNVEDEYPFVINGQVNPKYTLSVNMWKYLRDYKAKHEAKGNGFGFGLFGPNDVARTLSARYYKDGSEILISQGPRRRPRRLTPRECSRLMGFDQPGESNFIIQVSDTQAYRQFGNSVIVPKVTAIAEFMLPFLLEAINQGRTNRRTNVA